MIETLKPDTVNNIVIKIKYFKYAKNEANVNAIIAEHRFEIVN